METQTYPLNANRSSMVSLHALAKTSPSVSCFNLFKYVSAAMHGPVQLLNTSISNSCFSITGVIARDLKIQNKHENYLWINYKVLMYTYINIAECIFAFHKLPYPTTLTFDLPVRYLHSLSVIATCITSLSFDLGIIWPLIIDIGTVWIVVSILAS